MTDQDQPEKDEKDLGMNEKADEKVHEKQEESWEEKRRRDPLGSIAWAVILIWAGVVFLASNMNLLETLGPIGLMDAWSLVFAGAGAIMIVMVFVRLLVPEYRAHIVGTLILGMVFLGIGLKDTFGWNIIWPIVLIALGLAFLLGGIVRRG
ncbi:MAG: hypothetical protein V3S81_09885 [Anaerolineales bacterium]|nr:hypothetical protein [Anaerolineales bacterium]